MISKKIIFFCNIAGFLLFFVALSLALLGPEYLGVIHLSREDCFLVCMQLVSFLLLVISFHERLEISWRVFGLIASFLVLVESALMLDIWR